jgi:hypothetical protein
MTDRRYRAGDSVEDVCRACKLDRMHTVVVTDQDGRPLRVSCGYCGSEHNYRGGPAVAVRQTSTNPPKPGSGDGGSRRSSEGGLVPPRPRASAAGARSEGEFPLVSDRERTVPQMNAERLGDDVELLLRRIIREETGLTPVAPAEKWRNGQLVLRPGTAGLQEKAWPIETFFHKIVMLRNRLRTLEQQVNAMEIPEDAKLRLQGYITGCYGSLTSFNVLFADEEDQFTGTAS